MTSIKGKRLLAASAVSVAVALTAGGVQAQEIQKHWQLGSKLTYTMQPFAYTAYTTDARQSQVVIGPAVAMNDGVVNEIGQAQQLGNKVVHTDGAMHLGNLRPVAFVTDKVKEAGTALKQTAANIGERLTGNTRAGGNDGGLVLVAYARDTNLGEHAVGTIAEIDMTGAMVKLDNGNVYKLRSNDAMDTLRIGDQVAFNYTAADAQDGVVGYWTIVD